MSVKTLLAVVAASSVLGACASSSGRSDSGPDCTQPGVPVPVSDAFTDSAAVVELIRPLVGARTDTVQLSAGSGSWGAFASVDTISLPDSVARNALGERLTDLVVTRVEHHAFALDAHASDGAIRIDARRIGMCAPELMNRDDLANALSRAQRSVMANGQVVVHILVDTTGAAETVEVHQSSGNQYLDAAAVGVGYVARFTPAMREGVKVRVWAQIPITFVRPQQ